MVSILILTLVQHLHVGFIIVHYMCITDQIGIFLWGIFHLTLFFTIVNPYFLTCLN